MSASPEKKSRSSQRREEEQKDRRSVALYSAIGLAVVVFAVVLMFWNSGLLQRNLTALDLNGTKYSAADVQYYYNSIYASYANQYAFDPSTSVKKQVYQEETQMSWYDYLLDQALETLRSNAALAAKAKAEGFSITPESQTELDAFLAQLNTAWLSYGYNSREAFIKASFGTYMTYDRLAELVGMEYLAGDYAQSKLDAIDHPQADYDTYYQEHADELDTIVYSQLTFRAVLPTTDAEGNTHSSSYRVYYDYYICTVTLKNEDLSHLPIYIMSGEQLSRYALYMAALGNRPDLFPNSGYVDKYITNPPQPYDVPEQYLSDPDFAALLTEAEKYLGYPYVWGGSSPATSFDCSGFLSYVLNQCGWDVGRLGAQGLYNYCTPVSSPRPGDLVFFRYTYDAPNPDGVTHCGLYVGDGMMLHCGDPVQFTSLNTSYWQSHFYAWGRLP